MGFEFKSDQPEQKMVDTKTTLSVNEQKPLSRIPKNRVKKTKVKEDDNLTQEVFAEGEEEKLAIQFLEETGLYTKFLLYCGIQEQLKSLKDSLATPTE
jgi:hypothetical protein